jgi:hypothetical protein
MLEGAGFTVIEAMNPKMVRDACLHRKLNLVMIGYSVPPAEKRRAWQQVRKLTKMPILELYRNGRSELMDDTVISHSLQTEDDLLSEVRAIFRTNGNRRRKP